MAQAKKIDTSRRQYEKECEGVKHPYTYEEWIDRKTRGPAIGIRSCVKPVETPKREAIGTLLAISHSSRRSGIALADKCWNSSDRSFFSLANRLAGIVDALRHGDFTAEEAEGMSEEMAEYYAAMIRITDLIEESEPDTDTRTLFRCVKCRAEVRAQSPNDLSDSSATCLHSWEKVQ